MHNLTFGQRIVALRADRRILQKELAETVGITPTALNYYEKDKREPNVQTIIKIADALGVSCDELVGIYPSQYSIVLTKEEKSFIDLFRSLNASGQTKAIEYVNDLVASNNYKDPITPAFNSPPTHNDINKTG